MWDFSIKYVETKMMKTAVILQFNRSGNIKKGKRKGIASRIIADKLNKCTYREKYVVDKEKVVKVQARHVDGTMSASEREADLCC